MANLNSLMSFRMTSIGLQVCRTVLYMCLIKQHGSAVNVGMAVVVCMLYYERKVVLLLNRTEKRQTKLTMRKQGLNNAHG